MAAKAPPDDPERIISVALDAAFYRTIYTDVAKSGLDPIKHYAGGGWREGRDPAPWFSTERYLAANPDIAGRGLNPFAHYLREGRREGRDIFPSEHARRYFAALRARGETPAWRFDTARVDPEAAQAAAPPMTPERALAAPEFDEAFYLANNPDVAIAGADPLSHFLESGWREGRDPSATFSIHDYLRLNPDVASAGINPFLHYLETGRGEGRKKAHDLGFRYDVIANLVPMETRLEWATNEVAEVKPDRPARLAKALARSRSGLRTLHVTFSHDDYTAHVGGVQASLQREAAAFAELGRDHLHLYPARAWPLIRLAREPMPLGVVWNGADAGVYPASVIADALRAAAGGAGTSGRTFAIHSLLGHSVDETVALLESLGLKAGWFWLHDFASLCAGYHLMRNDVEDCGAPPPDSAACGICMYGPWRGRHLAEHHRLFERLELTVVGPSQTTLRFWRASSDLPARGEAVLPHASLAPRGPAPIRKEGPFRLAFPGMPANYKGWPVFRDLALRFAKDPRYEFVHLGGASGGDLPVRFRHVLATEDRPRAMLDALEAEQADAVLIWPICRETFSFTAYEGVAAGAAVITNPDSGNVAAFVSEGRHGRVLADEGALGALFESGEVLRLARAKRRPVLYDLAYSRMTAELLEAGR